MNLQTAAAILNVTPSQMARIANANKKRFKPKLVEEVRICSFNPKLKLTKLDRGTGKRVKRQPYSRTVKVLHIDGDAVNAEKKRREEE